MEKRKQPRPYMGKPMAMVLLLLVEEYGWKKLSEFTRITTFQRTPDFRSGLRYLRRTPSARKKVEALYRDTVQRKMRYTTVKAFYSQLCSAYL